MTISAERTLPVDAAHREFSVLVDGQAVPREHALVAATIVSVANQVGTARLVYADGVASASDFPLSNKAFFAPGRQIEIRAGSASQDALLFRGTVVRQRLKLRDGVSPQLHVECRHAAFRLALRRRSGNHFDLRDSDLIESLLSGAKVPGGVAETTVRHVQLVQNDTSDWDFILVRAAANGQAVLTRGADIETRVPAVSGTPVLTLKYGATLIELDAELDGRAQTESVKSIGWNPADQAVRVDEAQSPQFTGAGNLSPEGLAKETGADVTLAHAFANAEEARTLAQADWHRRQVDRIQGRAYCEGIGQVMPGDVVEIQGIGERFSGRIWVSGVRHELDQIRGWKTHLQFGGVCADETLQQRLSRARATAMIATMPGLQPAVVTSIDDPEGEHRVRVRLPLVSADDDGVWARVATLDAGKQRGFVFRPEVGDEVVVGFFDDDPRHPVVLGMLHSSARQAPIQLSKGNPEKGLVTRSGLKWLFDDDDKALSLHTPGGRQLRFSDGDGAMTISDASGNKIVLDSNGITLESQGAITLKAGTGLSLQAGTSLGLKAGTALALEGTASAELKSGGVAKVNASLVQIN